METRIGLTVKDVANRLRVGRGKIISWIKGGILSAVDTSLCGRGKPRWVIQEEELERFMAERSSKGSVVKQSRKRKSGLTEYYQG